MEILPGEWERRLFELTHHHAGRRVSLETSCGQTCSIYQMARHQSLRSIRLDPQPNRQGFAISISVGGNGNDLVTHSVANPAQLAIEQGEEGDIRAIRIQSEDGIVAVVRFE